jgi:predicted nucleic acid-binding protein
MIVVSDTSSISNLLQIGQIDILYALYGEITITPAVRKELYRLPDQETQIEQLNWIKVKAPKNHKMVTQLMDQLDLGESESVVLAIEEQAEYLIIDEYKGRKIADELGVKIVGILGVLIQAKKENIIPTVKENIDKLLEIGFRLDKRLIERVFKALGEI